MGIEPLERRGLLMVTPAPSDRRSRRLALTDAGREVLVAAVPIWRKSHDKVDTILSNHERTELKRDLGSIALGEAR